MDRLAPETLERLIKLLGISARCTTAIVLPPD
jgi:hypothetical protein